MKRSISLIVMAAILMTTLFVAPVSAAKVGDAIGNVLYTDIVAYINGYPIRSYNINGNTYIVAEDLMAYGFAVTWDGVNKRLVIGDSTGVITSTYQPTANTNPVGAVAFPYLYTDITTWIGSTALTSYNIGGFTCICMDDLATHYAETYVWDGEARALRMTLKSAAPAPAASSVIYDDKYVSISYVDFDNNKSGVRDVVNLSVSYKGGAYTDGKSYPEARVYCTDISVNGAGRGFASMNISSVILSKGETVEFPVELLLDQGDMTKGLQDLAARFVVQLGTENLNGSFTVAGEMVANVAKTNVAGGTVSTSYEAVSGANLIYSDAKIAIYAKANGLWLHCWVVNKTDKALSLKCDQLTAGEKSSRDYFPFNSAYYHQNLLPYSTTMMLLMGGDLNFSEAGTLSGSFTLTDDAGIATLVNIANKNVK